MSTHSSKLPPYPNVHGGAIALSSVVLRIGHSNRESRPDRWCRTSGRTRATWRGTRQTGIAWTPCCWGGFRSEPESTLGFLRLDSGSRRILGTER